MVIAQDLKREEERREAEESTRMAAEEQRQKDVSEAREFFVLPSLDWRWVLSWSGNLYRTMLGSKSVDLAPDPHRIEQTSEQQRINQCSKSLAVVVRRSLR